MERETASWHLFKNSTKRKKKEDMAINFKGNLIKETTTRFVYAVEQQAPKTNWIRKNIEEQEIIEKRNVCGELNVFKGSF